MDLRRYPLKISIPRTETARSTLRFRHTAYLIEIDDCGKLYTRHRRFTNFVWLHGELQRRQLGCDLPELPPKKSIGNMDPGFIESRRLTLEEYLQKLLLFPLVVQDDALWAFLDADLATAAVPRFLCRPRSQIGITDCLQTLEKVVAKPANVFRFCNEVVTQEFVDFAKAEAEGDDEVAVASNRSVPSSSTGYTRRNAQQMQQAMHAKLQNRIRFCNVLQPLIMHERARHGMVDLGMFGALIKLLARSVEDKESADDSLCEDYKRICDASRDNLQALLEGSNGAALLNFCQQDDGLSTLKRLASGNVALHQICASLLWHGLQNKDVVDALVGSAQSNSEIRPGLPLLGCLIRSDDLRSTVLASLCIATVVRHEGALDEDECRHCLEAIKTVPAELDKKEMDAIERTAKSNLDRASFTSSSTSRLLQPNDSASIAGTLGGRTYQGSEPGFVSLDRSSLLVPMLPIERDPIVATQLKTLCSEKDLPRLLPLLGDSGTIDEVTNLVVVLLDHFVQQFAEESKLLSPLSILAESLQKIVEVDEISINEEGFQAVQETWVSKIRIRAARILIRLDWAKSGEALGDPPNLYTFSQRAKILEVLNRHSTMCQEKAGLQIDAAKQKRFYQEETVSRGGLTQALCVGETRLAEFAREVANLETKRRSLEKEVITSTQAIDSMHENLERHGIKKARLKCDIDAIYESINLHADSLDRSDCGEVVARNEAALKEISAQVDERAAQKREIEADIRDKENRQRRAEAEWQEFQRRETELAEVCNTAPAQLQRVQATLRDCERRQDEVREKGETLESAQRHGEQRLGGLQRRKEEAEGALKKVRDIRSKLEDFQQTLNSEIVLTDAEVEKLRDFDVDLQPSRPARLRQSPEPNAENAEGVAEEGGPSWEDMTAEQECRSTPHFRSFSKLVAERKQRWEAELAWLEELLAQTRGTVADIAKNKLVVDQQLMQLKEEEARLSEQESAIADFDGHALRLAEAERAAAEARDLYLQLTTETAEANNRLQMTATMLEDVQNEKFQATVDLTKARETERSEMARFLQARVDMESRTTELEGRTRNFLQEWRCVELEEHRLNNLQKRVDDQLKQEADGRLYLREEARRLIAELQDLDQQLDVLSEIQFDTEQNASAG